MPRRKIIDDAKLIELFKQGKSLKQLGDELGVSHVAIHKRIRRLGLSQLPKSLGNLTEKEKQFCLTVASGQSRINAVMRTYDVTSRDSAKALQNTLMKNPGIKMAISDLMELKGIGREFRVEKLGEHMRNPDPYVSLKAVDMGFNLSGDKEKAKTQEKPSFINPPFINYPLELTRRPLSHFPKLEGKCALCEAVTEDSFCSDCRIAVPKDIERITRYWETGDKCAVCKDDRRCYEFCKACKEAEGVIHKRNGENG